MGNSSEILLNEKNVSAVVKGDGERKRVHHANKCNKQVRKIDGKDYC